MATTANNKKEAGHVMVSYCDCEELATYVYNYLKKKLKHPVWIDKVDMKGSSVASGTSTGIENCSAFVCLLTPSYQNTPCCKQEISYAANLRKPIIPCVVGTRNKFDAPDESDDEDADDDEWSSNDWLGLLVSDLAGISFEGVDKTNVDERCDQLIRKIENVLGDKPSK